LTLGVDAGGNADHAQCHRCHKSRSTTFHRPLPNSATTMSQASFQVSTTFQVSTVPNLFSTSPNASAKPSANTKVATAKAINVFTNDGSFLERFYRSKRVRLPFLFMYLVRLSYLRITGRRRKENASRYARYVRPLPCSSSLDNSLFYYNRKRNFENRFVRYLSILFFLVSNPIN